MGQHVSQIDTLYAEYRVAPRPREMSARTTFTAAAEKGGEMTGLTEKKLYELFKAGIEKEAEAQALYREGAALAGPGTRLAAMFEHLAVAEQEHERTLIEHYALFKAKLGQP
ncbi:MAG: hypothetical protein HY900_16635 [Deltaproteobacteria bacterium]|nr:hypothetical protein [Deltaproteobacteria bacterium]